MKYALMLLFTFFLFNILTPIQHAYASSGKLVGDMSYMDDSKANQKLSPFLDLQVEEACPAIKGLSMVGLIGGGYIDQPDGSDVKKTYGRLAADVYYQMDSWKLGAGGGLESNKDAYRSFGDYAHVSVEHPLW